MQLKVIPMSAIEPDKKNPRKDFGDIAALADSFKYNGLNPGEPVNPIVTVQDGEIYRIVDGERRYRAMKMNGIAECRAVVCDGMDEANAMMAMLTTDDKLTLSDVERSRGVQQMLLLGVDPQKVEKVGKMKGGSHKSVIRGIRSAGDKAQMMTLDMLILVDEFESQGDEDAVARLLKHAGNPAAFTSEAATIRREREREAKVKAFKDACEQACVKVADKVPEGYSFKVWANDPEQVAEKAKGLSAEAVAVIGYSDCSFYEPRSVQADEETPEQAAIRERTEKMRAAVVAAEDLQRQWFAARCGNFLCGSSTDALMSSRFFDKERGYTYNERRKRAMSVLGFEDEDAMPGDIDWISAWVFYAEAVSATSVVSEIVRGASSEWVTNRAKMWLEQLDSYVADGYEAGEADMAIADFLAGYINESEVPV